MKPARAREGCGGAHDQRLRPARGSVAPRPCISAGPRRTRAKTARPCRAPAGMRDAVEQQVRPRSCSRPAVSGVFPGRKRAVELRVRRLRYCSDSVVSKRRKVTFLSKRHVRVRTPTHRVNGEKQANMEEHFAARLHRELLSPDECCPRGLMELLKGCGSRRENRLICSVCGAPVFRLCAPGLRARVFPGRSSGGRSGSSSPAAPDSAAEWWLPARAGRSAKRRSSARADERRCGG